MKFRKKAQVLRDNLENSKIVFFIGPRQVGKTTIMKQVFSEIETDKKVFLNLEILDYHKFFADFQSIQTFLFQNGFGAEEKFYLFLDEFHKVKNISWILKSLYDEYPHLKLVVTGSNNIEINKNITESYAGRKRVISCYPLDFEEFIIWKENVSPEKISQYIQNPLNTAQYNLYIEEFLIYGGYPEIVQAGDHDEKIQIFADIFSFWFHKDILPEIKKDYKFNDFLKHLGYRNSESLNMNEVAGQVGISQPTGENYSYLLQESLLVYPVRPYFSNKLKEIIKTPKIYFIDTGFRNFITGQFQFSQSEKGALFESFIFSEFLKAGHNSADIKYWRTKTGTREIDFIIEYTKTAFEVKYRNTHKKSDLKGITAFISLYPDFLGEVIYSNNFYQHISTTKK